MRQSAKLFQAGMTTAVVQPKRTVAVFCEERGDDGMLCRTVLYGVPFTIIASWGQGWDHVSVSTRNRCPSWDEMCIIKDVFFHPYEAVMQLHPPESEYVNNHPYCLHLWRPQEQPIPLPPSIMVGFKELGILTK